MAILPIPTTRVSDLLASTRLTGQIQSDQQDLLRSQTQISTGRRIISPSDDAPSALRAINIQRTLERKAQNQISLRDSMLFLGEAESSVNEVTNILNSIKSEALAVDSTLSTAEERQAVIDQIDRSLEQLVNIGNSEFRERFLFAGSRSQSQPYGYQGNFVAYHGNEQHLRSYVDASFLYETNVPGVEVFGGISAQVVGSVDLNPQVTSETQLRHLNGGEGITGGAVELVHVDSLGNATSTIVDLSNAATLGDVARYLELGAPEDSGIQVQVSGTGLEISATDPTEGVIVREVGEGRTARDLGVYSTTTQNTIVGDDIGPELLKTTPLGDLLGTKAWAFVESAGDNNDFIVRATQNGTHVDPDDPLSDPLNGVTIQFVDGGTAGSETALYDAAAGTLTVTIEDGVSTTNQIIDAINAEASGLFVAEADLRDVTQSNLAGEGLVDVAVTATTSGGSGTDLDTTSGLLVSNGGTSVEVDISAAETVEELVNLLNQAELGLQVEINEAGNGINVRSRWSGADLTIGEVLGGTTATQLGLRTLTEDTRIEEFNRGVGVVVDDVTTFEIELTTLGVPTTFEIDLDGDSSLQDVIDSIAAQTGGAVTAQLVSHGNGIELVDNTAADTIRVSGQPAQLLGFFGSDETEITGTGALTAEDRNTLETDSVFNTLIRLRDAIKEADYPAIGREITRIDEDLDRVNFARSELGARLQSLQSLEYRHEDEEIALREALSEEIDVDLTQAISEYTQKQYALQASLRITSDLLQVTLFDYL